MSLLGEVCGVYGVQKINHNLMHKFEPIFPEQHPDADLFPQRQYLDFRDQCSYDLQRKGDTKKVQEPTIHYIFQCIHCKSNDVIAVINDGGSIQNCNRCNKMYKATFYYK